MNQIITASDKCCEELKQVRGSESPKEELILTGSGEGEGWRRGGNLSGQVELGLIHTENKWYLAIITSCSGRHLYSCFVKGPQRLLMEQAWLLCLRREMAGAGWLS